MQLSPRFRQGRVPRCISKTEAARESELVAKRRRVEGEGVRGRGKKLCASLNYNEEKEGRSDWMGKEGQNRELDASPLAKWWVGYLGG